MPAIGAERGVLPTMPYCTHCGKLRETKGGRCRRCAEDEALRKAMAPAGQMAVASAAKAVASALHAMATDETAQASDASLLP